MMKQVLYIPNSVDTIVLYDPDLMPKGTKTLVRLDVHGKVVWEAELPPYDVTKMNDDVYVAATVSQGATIGLKPMTYLHANSFSCYFVEINLSTGKIISSTFTK